MAEVRRLPPRIGERLDRRRPYVVGVGFHGECRGSPKLGLYVRAGISVSKMGQPTLIDRDNSRSTTNTDGKIQTGRPTNIYHLKLQRIILELLLIDLIYAE